MLKKIGFLERRDETVSLFTKVSWLSNTYYERKTAIILWKFKNNYLVWYIERAI